MGIRKVSSSASLRRSRHMSVLMWLKSVMCLSNGMILALSCLELGH